MRFEDMLLPTFLFGVMGYDNEEQSGDDAPPPNDDAPPSEDQPKTFDQAAVNKFLANERKSLETKYKAQLQKSEKTYQDLLANNRLTKEERDRLESSLSDVQKEMRTKEEQAAYEKKQLENKFGEQLSEAQKEAEFWQNRYRTNEIKRTLQDAAIGADAYNAQQVVTLLRENAKLIDVTDEATGKLTGEHRVVIEYAEQNDSGETVLKVASPNDYLKGLKDKPEYMNLFKSAMQSGLGVTNFGGGPKGEVDLSKLTGAARTEAFRKLRAERPEALGMRSNKPVSK
jgi:hypothetical protein